MFYPFTIPGDAGSFLSNLDFTQFLPFIAIFAALYFLIIRPQQKKAQQQREMLSALGKGDRVVTAGGMIGAIVSLDGEAEVLIDVEGNQIRILRSAITDRIVASTNTNNVRELKPKAADKTATKKTTATTSKRKTTAKKATK